MNGLRLTFCWVVGLGCFIATVAPTPGQAFCRASIETVGADCEPTDAPYLFWSRSCLTYAFHKDVFDRIPALSETQIRDIAEQSFGAWSDVDCGRGSFFVQQAPGTTDAEPIGFLYDAPNTFVVSVLTPRQWAESLEEEGADAFAITYLWRDKKSGEIFDVDMALNLTTGPFGSCNRPCSDGTIDLQNTLTHEAGHVLGLGHSETRLTTMFKDARHGANFMRTLEEDDRAGLCALELPVHGCSGSEATGCSCPPPRALREAAQSNSCTISPGPAPESPPGWVLTGLCLLGAGLVVRGRRNA